MSKTIIFLDFDGVLCDSVKEAYILSRFAYCGYDVHKAIEKDKYLLFCKYRYLISNSWQYCYLMQAIEEDAIDGSVNVEKRFLKLITNKNEDLHNSFNKKFLNERKFLIDNEFKFWNSLETPTSFLVSLSRFMKNTAKLTFAILSTNNKEAIVEKLKIWDIEFDTEYIFDKQNLADISKGDFIRNYLNDNSCFEKAFLIDDNEENIQSCFNVSNITPLLTDWGYNKNSVDSLSEETIINIIKEIL